MAAKTVKELISTGTYALVFDGDVLVNSGDFVNYVKQKWGHMTFVADGDDAQTEWQATFATWKNLVGDDLHRIWETMTADYEPLENYYRKELGSEETDKHNGHKMSSNTDMTSTPTVKTQVANVAYGYNSSTAVPSNGGTSEMVSGNTHTTGTASNNYTEVSDISSTVFDKDVHTFIDRVTRGNIGVTTSQQMAESEIMLRMKKYLMAIIDSFILEFTFYVGGV